MNSEATSTASQENINVARHGTLKKYLGWIKHISVEPTMWLYMMAFMVTSVVEQAFFVHKACLVDHGFSKEICSSLNDNETLQKQVQKTVSTFLLWNNIAGHIVPIILALFFGNWSDRHGRKLFLVLGLTGKLIYSFMVVINALMDSWDLNMVIYTATIPMSLLGGDVAIFATCFAYISDITTIEQRTFRITILDVIYLSTMPTGVALGSFLFYKVLNQSYAYMFTINSTLLAIAIVYSLLILKWQTSPKQQPARGWRAIIDFFDKKHVVATMTTLTKHRKNMGRLHLWIFLIAMTLYTFQRDEKPMSYLYTRLIFKWTVGTFSNFRTFQSALFVVAMLIGAPTMSRILKMSDTTIIIIGALAHAAGRVVFALAKIPILFYVGAAVAAIGPVVAPVLRSMTSKLVSGEERGKVLAMLSVCDNAVPLFSGFLYSAVYNSTIDTAPSSIYWLTFATQISVLLLIIVVRMSTKKDNEGQPINYYIEKNSDFVNDETQEQSSSNSSINNRI